MALANLRIRAVGDAPARRDGDYVLYWMTAARRLESNFALQRAVELARKADLPLVVLEAISCWVRWSSDRFHRFVLDGMREKRDRLTDSNVLYYPYVEPTAGHGKGLVAALADRAHVVVTDDYPAFFLPAMLEAQGEKLGVRIEAVDSNGLLPLSVSERAHPTAYSFRKLVHREIRPHLETTPVERPLARFNGPAASLPGKIETRWPAARDELLEAEHDALAGLEIDHSVRPVDVSGGGRAARKRLREFITERLTRYVDDRNSVDDGAASGLSPYLHFGHISAHTVFREVAKAEGWDPSRITGPDNGRRSGWWGASDAVEGFFDQLITWRELGYHFCRHEPRYASFDTLPDWAQATLRAHAKDRREHVYTLDAFEAGKTHDELWNAAQHQLVREGTIHNYLRMLWGKKILEWSATPREALDVMIELNNKYALDGRDPNAYSGIFWVLGRFDRAFGPERKVLGTVRYMSSANTVRKIRLKQYLASYA